MYLYLYLTTALSLAGSPIQEKHPLSSLRDLEPALPYIQPTGLPNTGVRQQPQQQYGMPLPVAVSTREPQEQAEIGSHRSSNQAPASSINHSKNLTRVPHPPGTVDPPSRFV